MEMDDKKTKVECRLITRGTDKANANAISDLNIPDPESTVGEQILKLRSELQLLELKLRNDEYDHVTQKGPKIPMSEAKKIVLEMRAKRKMILDLHSFSD